MFYVKEQLNDAMEVPLKLMMRMFTAAAQSADVRCRWIWQVYLRTKRLICLVQQFSAVSVQKR